MNPAITAFRLNHVSDSCFLLIDGGGSGSRARLTTRQGDILAEASGRPANVASNYEEAVANLKELATDTYQEAARSTELKSLDFALIGLAGAGAILERERFESEFGCARTKLLTDIDLTTAAALGPEQDGVVAMLGTGSFFVRRLKGKLNRVGGWGFRVGDECGGAWLGRELLRTTLHAHDGVVPHSDLTRTLLMRFENSAPAIVRFAREASAAEFAKFAPDVVSANRQSDGNARRIMSQSLALLQMFLGPAENICGQHLCFMGGLGSSYQALLPVAYQDLCHPAFGSMLDGAFALAQREFG